MTTAVPKPDKGGRKESVETSGDITGQELTGAGTGQAENQAEDTRRTGQPTPTPKPDPKPDPKPSDDAPQTKAASEVAATEAEKTAQAAWKAGEEARMKSILEQKAAGGAVNQELALEAGRLAADRAMQKSIVKGGPGVYVRSQVVLMSETGTRRDCPEGMRIPDAMLGVQSETEIARLVAAGVLDDLR